MSLKKALKNAPMYDLSDVNPFAGIDHKPVYDGHKLDTLERERYQRAIEADNWDDIFDEENNEL